MLALRLIPLWVSTGITSRTKEGHDPYFSRLTSRESKITKV